MSRRFRQASLRTSRNEQSGNARRPSAIADIQRADVTDRRDRTITRSVYAPCLHPLAGLLGWNRDRQPRPPPGAPAFEDLASPRRGHPGEESVRAFAAAIVRLISPFHRSRPTCFLLDAPGEPITWIVRRKGAPRRRAPNRLSNHTHPATASTGKNFGLVESGGTYSFQETETSWRFQTSLLIGCGLRPQKTFIHRIDKAFPRLALARNQLLVCGEGNLAQRARVRFSLSAPSLFREGGCGRGLSRV